jgi:hypothetical protein
MNWVSILYGISEAVKDHFKAFGYLMNIGAANKN